MEIVSYCGSKLHGAEAFLTKLKVPQLVKKFPLLKPILRQSSLVHKLTPHFF